MTVSKLSYYLPSDVYFNNNSSYKCTDLKWHTRTSCLVVVPNTKHVGTRGTCIAALLLPYICIYANYFLGGKWGHIAAQSMQVGVFS